jgi:DNA-binding beta-propeller fold protein YncE
LLRLDAATGEFRVLPLQHGANHMLALAPDGGVAFVSHAFPGGITRFDLAKDAASAHAKLPAGAEGIAAVRRGDATQVWVGCNRSSKLVVVDGATLRVVHELERPGFPLRVKARPDGERIAVSCPKSGEVAFYAAGDPNQAPTVVDLGAALDGEVMPTSIAWSPDGALLLVVANGDIDRIVAIDVAAAKVVATHEALGPIADALVAAMVRAPLTSRGK